MKYFLRRIYDLADCPIEKVSSFRSRVSILCEIRLSLWLQLREGARYWCRRNQQGALLTNFQAREIAKKLHLRNCREIAPEKLSRNCSGTGNWEKFREEWLWWWKPWFWTCTRIWESKWKKLKLKETKNIERNFRFLVIELLLMDVDGNPFPKKEFSSSSSVQFNPLLSHFY